MVTAMLDIANKALNGFSDLVRLFSLLLIGGIMVSIGLMLAAGGRPEGAIPLILGLLAFFQVPALVKTLYQDLTGDY